jgi:hypothetical protein
MCERILALPREFAHNTLRYDCRIFIVCRAAAEVPERGNMLIDRHELLAILRARFATADPAR